MSNRWPGGIINGAAPVPTGGGAGDSAPGVWTLDQADQYIAVQEWPGTGTPDPQFQYVTALLHGDGTNGGQNNTFLDSSSNNFTITRNGNTTQGSFSPYGNLWSNFFGTSNYLTTPNAAWMNFGTGDFTIESWVYFNSVSSAQMIVTSNYNAGTGGGGWAFIYRGDISSLSLSVNSNVTYTRPWSPSVGVWYHVAVSRSGTNLRLFVNGTQLGATFTSSDNVSNSSTLVVANNLGGSPELYLNGYLSNLRINTSALYTSDFTPSTTPLTAITNTQLLTCQSNRFRDASTNNVTVTSVGSPSVQRFSPFQNLATYQPAVIGGSGYFPGSDNGLSCNSGVSGNFPLGSAFTFEAWFYATSISGFNTIFALGGSSLDWNASTGLTYNCGLESGNVAWQWNSGGATYLIQTACPLNQWVHLAVGYSGGTTRLWINGVSAGTSSNGYNITSYNSFGIGVANNGSGNKFTPGYISNVRYVAGTDIYGVGNSTITVPTAPLTSVSGTKLLTNFTNGAIFDSDATNNFETVGNAQISTSVVKFGTGSMAFDGTGDWLSAPATPQSNLGSGNFTLECWLYRTASGAASDSGIVSRGAPGNTNGFVFGYNSSNQLTFNFNYSGVIVAGASAIPINTWNHVAVTRVGNTFRLFLNGQINGTATSSNSQNTNAADVLYVGRSGFSSDRIVTGYIDDLRITLGYARYWFNFQPPTRAFPNYGGTVIELEDPLFQYNTLLLNGNGTNGAQNNTFLDSSTNNFTITRNGNTTQGSFSPYGNLWSNYFPGSSSFSGGTSFSAIGTGDFTVEFWVNIYTYSPVNVPITIGDSKLSSGFEFLINNTGNIRIYSGDAYLNNITSVAVPLNTWTHIAFVRSSGTITTYFNGVSVNTISNSSSISGSPYIGAERYNSASTNYMYGYISNMRVTTNAVYSANFAPSTTPLTAISGTVLLTCQGNRFIDASTNNATITISGTPSVQRFSPFNPTAPYSTSVIGGSGYFDGTGDSLSVANNTALEFGSGDFTIETFVYFNSLATNRGIVYLGTDPNSNFSYGLQWSGNVLYFWYTTNGSDLTNKNASWTPVISTWYHVAVTRSGNDLRFFVDGAQIGTTQSLSGVTIFDSTSAMLIGGEATGSPTSLPGPMNGYISNLRILKGTALYTGSYTIPTAPLTAITNTSLLTNMTNAGIPDLAMMNNLETVGNAQVSTAQSKFGGSSLAFDGSGDYLTAPNNAIYNLGSGSWTVEFWMNPTAAPSIAAGIIYKSSHSSNQGWWVIYYPNYIGFGLGSGSPIVQSAASSISVGTWTHVAIVNNSGTGTIYINGSSSGTASISSFTDSSTVLAIGALDTATGWNANYPYNGYIQDLRVTRGIARYVQPFTPPTQAFQTY
jgi:hypothetical protein